MLRQATKKEIEIEKGDTLLVRCTYNSTAKTTFTHTGILHSFIH